MVIDEVDRKIVEYLQDDGSTSDVKLASLLGVSDSTARRRRLRLIEEDVIRVVAVANPFKLGFEVIAIIGIIVTRNMLQQVESALVLMPHVRFVGATLGRYSLMVEAWFKSSEEFLQFMTASLAQVEGIQQTEAFQIMRLSKYAYDWGKPQVALGP